MVRFVLVGPTEVLDQRRNSMPSLGHHHRDFFWRHTEAVQSSLSV